MYCPKEINTENSGLDPANLGKLGPDSYLDPYMTYTELQPWSLYRVVCLYKCSKLMFFQNSYSKSVWVPYLVSTGSTHTTTELSAAAVGAVLALRSSGLATAAVVAVPVGLSAPAGPSVPVGLTGGGLTLECSPVPFVRSLLCWLLSFDFSPLLSSPLSCAAGLAVAPGPALSADLILNWFKLYLRDCIISRYE